MGIDQDDGSFHRNGIGASIRTRASRTNTDYRHFFHPVPAVSVLSRLLRKGGQHGRQSLLEKAND